MDNGLRLAIEAMGSSAALANALKLHRGTVHHWERVPYSQLLAVERVTGIDRSLLRPEMFAGWCPPSNNLHFAQTQASDGSRDQPTINICEGCS